MTIKGEVILVGLISKGNSSEYNYDQLKLQTLESWCQQQQKLGNLPPTAADRYQIMRPDHQLGINCFRG